MAPLTRAVARSVPLALLVAMALSGQLVAQEGEGGGGKKPVISIAGFVDNSESPVWDVIQEVRPLLQGYLNQIGLVEHQSAEDIVQINTAREMLQMATGASGLESVQKLAAKGIDKFIFLQLNSEQGADGRPMDALYGLVLDTRTRDFSVLPLGTYANKYVKPGSGQPGPPKKKIVKKVKIAKKRDRAAKWAARVMSRYATVDDKRTRDIAYSLNGTIAEMERKSYGKALAAIFIGGAMIGGMQGAAYGLDAWITSENEENIAGGDTTVHVDQGKAFVGVFQIMSIAYAAPILIGFRNFGERVALGIQHKKLQARYRDLTGERYRLPKIPRK